MNPFSLKAPARSVAFRLKKGCKKWRSQPDGGAVFQAKKSCSLTRIARTDGNRFRQRFLLLMMFEGSRQDKNQAAKQNDKTDQQHDTGHGAGFLTSSGRNSAVHAGWFL
ncbi:hypothetical protein ABIB18_003739 [Pantoea sp. UYEF8]